MKQMSPTLKKCLESDSKFGLLIHPVFWQTSASAATDQKF